MIPLQIVERYTRSIFELAGETGTEDSLFQELSAVRNAMSGRPELLRLLQNPLITRTEKRSLIEGILGSKAHSLSGQFLNLLVDKNRIDLYPYIVDRLRKVLNERQGVEEATLVTAHELHPSIVQLLQKALERSIKKKVIIRTETEPELLGGIQIHMGNRLIDGSIRTKLNDLETQLRTMKV